MSFQTVTMTLLDGFLLNIELFAVTLVLSLPLGLVVSFGTMSRFKPLSLLVRLYVYIMRSTPLMLQLAVVFYLPGIVFGPGHSLGRIITLVKDTSLSNFIMVGEIIKLAKDFGNKGMIWPLFYAGAFFLVFNGIVTLALSRTEKKLDYFRV